MKRLLCFLRIHGPAEFGEPESPGKPDRYSRATCAWCGKQVRT